MVTSGGLARHGLLRRKGPLPGIKFYCMLKMPFPGVVPYSCNLLERISCLRYSNVRYYWNITNWLFALLKIKRRKWKIEYRVKVEEHRKAQEGTGWQCRVLFSHAIDQNKLNAPR